MFRLYTEPEDVQCMTEICKRKKETEVIHTFISAFVCVTYMDAIRINARCGTHKHYCGVFVLNLTGFFPQYRCCQLC